MIGQPHAALACVLTLAAAAPAAAQSAGEALLKAFPRGEEACYERVYDPTHLARHPRQRMSAFHLFKSLTADPMKEEGYRLRPAESAHDRKETGPRWLSVLVRFKDKPGRLYKQQVECGEADGGFSCGRDCDGGSFHVALSGDRLRLSQSATGQGLRLAPACDADMEDEGEMLDPKDDATTWRLERLPMTACHAERDAARPSYARTTAPLTERFADRNRVCHARTYDADHLARHPNQTVVSMTLMTEDRVRGNDEGGRITTFVPVRLSVTLRDGTVATRSARCDAVDYELGCSGEGGGFTLVRSGERGLEVRDLNRKRTDGPDNWLAKFLRAPLGDDDRVFRLDEASDPTCGPASPR